MKYVGLDLSLASTGMAVLEDISFIPVKTASVITKPNKMHYMERYCDIADTIISTYFIQKDDYVLIEDYAFGARFGVAQQGELGGIVKYKLWKDCGIGLDRIFVCSPRTLKKFVLGEGKGDKNMMLREIYKKYQYEAPNDDVADAYGLAMMIRKIMSFPETGLHKYELECKKSVLERNGLLGKPPVRRKK